MNQPPYELLERGILASLETYSNVHRGSGTFARVMEHLLEQSRQIVMDFLKLNPEQHAVVFCSPRRAENLTAGLVAGTWRSVSSKEIGLPLGIVAVGVDIAALPKGIPTETGGGTARLIAPGWVVWNKNPDRFEAGTPPLVSIFALARALKITGTYGKDAFLNAPAASYSAADILYDDVLKGFNEKILLEKLRLTRIGRLTLVPTVKGMQPFIYLDNAASHPTFQPVWKAVCQAWQQPDHVRAAIVTEVRSICARFLEAPPEAYEIDFTSNATEAINLVAAGLHREFSDNSDTVIVNTMLEHSSNELPWRNLPDSTLVRLSVSEEGFIDVNNLELVLKEYNTDHRHGEKRIRLVAVSGGSNVLGVYNDLESISRVVHKYGARLLVDAAQLIAHRPVYLAKWNIDYLAFSAHKTYAPFGTGVLVHRKGLLAFPPDEFLRIRNSGEENTGGIAALGKALVLLERISLKVVEEEEGKLTAYALKGLASIPRLRIFGIKDPANTGFRNKGGVIVFSLRNQLAEQLAEQLALRGGIGIRWGCHCAHLLVKFLLHVPRPLEEFQRLLLHVFKKIRLPGLARVSLGIGNTGADIDILIKTLQEIAIKDKTTAPADLSPNIVKQQTNAFVEETTKRVFEL